MYCKLSEESTRRVQEALQQVFSKSGPLALEIHVVEIGINTPAVKLEINVLDGEGGKIAYVPAVPWLPCGTRIKIDDVENLLDNSLKGVA